MKYIIDIKGEIEGDYEIIGKYEERPMSERKKGKWKRAHGVYYDRANCSNCDRYYPIDPEFPFNNPMEWNFCPNCGADMRGGET